MSGRVLVVDDVATNRLLLRAKLSSAYYDVSVAENGHQALEMARREQPDMIMLDVMMPDLDGFEVCAKLKSMEETAHIPVIMVTALDTPEERIRGLEAGADDFLSKPFNDLALFARVRNLMRMKMMFDELRLRDLTSRELGLTDFVTEQEIELELGGSLLLAPPSEAAGADWAGELRRRLNLSTIVTSSEREALNLARLELPDCFVVHQKLMEGGDGLRLVSALRARPETRQSAVILVVEAGDDHDCPYYQVPIMQAYASEDPDLAWNFYVHHYDDAGAARRDPKYVDGEGGVLYPRGSTLGGSTAVSAMVTIYPHDDDWQRLAELTGDDSWGPERMRELFTRMERWRGKDAEPLPGDTPADRDRMARHGHDGWLGTTRARW